METRRARSRFSLVAVPSSNRLAAFARDVRHGLTSSPKHLSCCYFYDGEGSFLFEEICALPEYYLTRAEREIFAARAADISARCPAATTLVELGSGSAVKTRLLIEALLARQETLRYVPIDICSVMLEDSSRKLLAEYPDLEILAVAAEYREGLRHLHATAGAAKLILWLGSNVGNFDRLEAVDFLRQVRTTMRAGDGLLIGIDLRKDRAVLERAYDDAQGVTADFNLNLLARINRELGGHFDLDAFQHWAIYQEEPGRMEMYLRSRRFQRVPIDNLDLEVSFAEREMIHTENSYKYSFAEIESLAAAVGFRIACQWLDSEGRFSLNLMTPH
jgi:L-histidine N-alpha-methyltransferase